MKPVLLLITVCVFCTANVFAQRILVTNVNKHMHGAVYRFSFAQITDVHVGEGIPDYGTPGYANDTMPAGDVGKPAMRLRYAINWINKNAVKHHLKFLAITGDLTDSGEKSEFDKVNEIASTLTIPFIPQIGNHDVIAHNNLSKASTAYGDSVDAQVFKHEFDTLQNIFTPFNNGLRGTRVYSPYSKGYQYLQNFMFTYQGFGFMFCDFNPRFKDKRPATDHGPKPRLNNFEGGTFNWMLQTLAAYPNKGNHNIFIFTHQPPHHDVMAHYNGLPANEYALLAKSLLPYRANLALWLAGHVHRNKAYNLHLLHATKKVMRVRETAANKARGKGTIRIINVYSAQ